MRLLDTVCQAPEAIVVTLPGEAQPWRFPGSNILAAKVVRCPLRYVLDDDVTELCTQLAFEDDTILGTSLELVRVPAPTLWIEFVGSARNKVFSDLGRLAHLADTCRRQRIGLLVTGDPSGRRGSIDVCWENGESIGPDLAPFSVEFDLDDASFSGTGRTAGDGSLIGISISDAPTLSALFDHVRFRLHPQWQKYYRQNTRDDVRYREVLLKIVRPLLEDVPFFALFCLLLSSKNALRSAPVELTRLNKARERRGRSPLLNHIELSMNLMVPDHHDTQTVVTGQRSSPRLHFVRGHLVRRGDAVYWRSSHMRGSAAVGSIYSRTISLHMPGT